ncbi:MAG: hypothetical protein DHS20C21_05880 [Gemmatimonadota bacterium]|nr:MAG: hypothetical protein DHS20C21_05880 [Gemmatimonadota bacterium]
MKALGDVVLFKIDAEKGEGPDLAAQYKVQGYPTFVVANAEGDVMDTWNGYAKESFLDMLSPAVTDPTTIDEKTTRFASAPTALDGIRVARYHATRGDYVAALGFVDKVDKLQDAPNMAALRFDYTASEFIYNDGLSVDAVRMTADAVVASSNMNPNEVVNVAQTMQRIGRKVEDPTLGVAYLAPALAATKGTTDEGLAKTHARLAVDHALLVEKNADKAVQLKYATMPEGWKDDPSALNSFSWWCFEANTNLDEALVLARRGAELASPGKDRAMILDTAAEICNAQGNCDDAVELIRQALAEHGDSEHYQKQLVRFEEIRAASQAN